MNSVFKNKLFHQFFLSYLLILGGVTLVLLSFGSSISSEAGYYFDQLVGKQYVLDSEEDGESSPEDSPEPKGILSQLIEDQVVKVEPVNKDFSIIIEDIGVNAPVVENVGVSDEDEYFEALKKGVAHAEGKSLPGETGNVYLFAHSSIEFWRMGPYATVFNQLRRLENGDIVYIYYNGELYKYQVFSKKVVDGFDLEPLQVDYNNRSILTLQTCDPPGTTLNRLIVRAFLVE